MQRNDNRVKRALSMTCALHEAKSALSISLPITCFLFEVSILSLISQSQLSSSFFLLFFSYKPNHTIQQVSRSFPLLIPMLSPLLLNSSFSFSFSFSKDAPPPTKDAVYVATVPLRAAPGPPQMLLSTAYHLGHRHLRHYVVLIKSSHQVLLFDFQPKDPENIFSALSVISQRKLPGVILKREITRIPRARCWFVGFSKGNSLEIANRFNQNWSTDLVVGTNDCRDYTNVGTFSLIFNPKRWIALLDSGLVECLTGEENVLESLKQTFN